MLLAHMLVLHLGASVKNVSWTSDMKDWNETDYCNVGRSMAIFMRTFQTAESAVDAWIKNYPQLSILADEVEGFAAFMFVIASGLLRDNKFGS